MGRSDDPVAYMAANKYDVLDGEDRHSSRSESLVLVPRAYSVSPTVPNVSAAVIKNIDGEEVTEGLTAPFHD